TSGDDLPLSGFSAVGMAGSQSYTFTIDYINTSNRTINYELWQMVVQPGIWAVRGGTSSMTTINLVSPGQVQNAVTNPSVRVDPYAGGAMFLGGCDCGYEGGSFWDSIVRGIKKGANLVADVAAPLIPAVQQNLVNKLMGTGMMG